MLGLAQKHGLTNLIFDFLSAAIRYERWIGMLIPDEEDPKVFEHFSPQKFINANFDQFLQRMGIGVYSSN